jgi:hypothetical protein
LAVPLTEKVSFRTRLQRGNRVQVPKLVRWRFKMEPDQVLKIGVDAVNVFSGGQIFYGRMGKDGRILIPKLALALLTGKESSLAGYVMDVSIEPA